MVRNRLVLAVLASAAGLAGGDSVRWIGDVRSESPAAPRGAAQRRTAAADGNAALLKGMLGKEHFDPDSDECLDPDASDDGRAVYGRCDIRKFPYCHGDRPNICFNRINRQDAFWPDKHPRYYIDYDRVHCYPDRARGEDFTCSSCSPGRWCMPEGRCILDEKRYHCWDI